MSGPEVRKFSKLWTVRKPDVFQKEIIFFLFIYFVKEKKYQFDVILLFGMKMFQNICKGPVQQDLSRKFGYPVLSGQETQMPCLVEPYIVDARR